MGVFISTPKTSRSRERLPQHKRLAMGRTVHGGDTGGGLRYKGATRTIKPSDAGQKPITFHPGGLHESLGVAKGEKIPKSKLRAAQAGKYGPKAKRQANMAVNVFHVRTKRAKVQQDDGDDDDMGTMPKRARAKRSKRYKGARKGKKAAY